MHARPPRKRQQTAALAASPELSERGIATCVLGGRTSFDLLGPEGLKRKVDHETGTLDEQSHVPRRPRETAASLRWDGYPTGEVVVALNDGRTGTAKLVHQITRRGH